MRAAEWWERCRLIGGGNRQRGAVRLAAAERRDALRVNDSCGLAKAGPMDKASSAADQPNIRARRQLGRLLLGRLLLLCRLRPDPRVLPACPPRSLLPLR